MATEKCGDCGNTISTSATKCPHCGRPLRAPISGAKILIVLLAGLLGTLIYMSQKADDKAEESNAKLQNRLDRLRGAGNDSAQDIYDQVAADAVRQYQIAKRQGDPMQICVQAGFVTAGFLQAKNERLYRRWKEVEALDCKRAGVPR